MRVLTAVSCSKVTTVLLQYLTVIILIIAVSLYGMVFYGYLPTISLLLHISSLSMMGTISYMEFTAQHAQPLLGGRCPVIRGRANASWLRPAFACCHPSLWPYEVRAEVITGRHVGRKAELTCP